MIMNTSRGFFYSAVALNKKKGGLVVTYSIKESVPRHSQQSFLKIFKFKNYCTLHEFYIFPKSFLLWNICVILNLWIKYNRLHISTDLTLMTLNSNDTLLLFHKVGEKFSYNKQKKLTETIYFPLVALYCWWVYSSWTINGNDMTEFSWLLVS